MDGAKLRRWVRLQLHTVLSSVWSFFNVFLTPFSYRRHKGLLSGFWTTCQTSFGRSQALTLSLYETLDRQSSPFGRTLGLDRRG